MAHRRSTKDLRVFGDNGSQRDGWSATMSQESFDTCWTPREQSGLTAGRPPATPVPAKKTSRRGVLSPLGLDDMRHSLESEALPPEPSTSPSRPGLADTRRRAKKNALPPTNINPFLVARKKRNRRRKRISLHTTHVSRYLMDFEEIDCIGRGTNCEVFRCRRREDGCTYAMKRVIRPVKGPASKAPAMKEVFALSALSGCPHIVRYYSAWREDEKLYIQTELCWGSAEDLVTNQRHRHIDSGSTQRAMNAPDSVEEEIMAAPRIPSTARKPVSSKSRLVSMDSRPQHMEGGGSRMRRMAPPARPQKQQSQSFGLHPGGAGNDTVNTRVTPTLNGAADSISSNEANAVGTPNQGQDSGGSTPVMRPADSRLVGGFLHVTGATGGGSMGRMRDLKPTEIDDDSFLDEDRTEAARTGLGGAFDLAGRSGRDSAAMDEEDCNHRVDTAEYTDSRVSHSLQVPLSTSQSSLRGQKTRGASESYEGVLGRTAGGHDGANAEEGGEDDTWITELNMKGTAPHRADGTGVRRHTQTHLRQRSTFDSEGGRGRVGSSVTMMPQATVSRESSDDHSRPDSGPTTRHTPSIQRAAGESARHHVLNEMRWRANTFGTGRDQPRVLSQSSVEYEFRDSDGMDTASAAVTPITQSPAAPKGTRGFGILPTPAKGRPSSPHADGKSLSVSTSDQVFAGAQGTGSAEYGEGGQILKAHVRSSRESSLGPDTREGNAARPNRSMADVYAIEAQRRSLESLYAESFDTDGSMRDSAESWKFNGRTRLDFGDAVVAVEDLQSPGAVREGSAGYLAARQQYQSAIDGDANPVVPFRAGGMQGGDDGMELQDVSMELHDADVAHADAVGVHGVQMEAATTDMELEGGWAAQSLGAETADSLLRSGGDDKRCRVGASGGPFRGPSRQRASDDWCGRRSAPSPALEVMVVAPDSGLVIPASEGRGRMVESELIRLCEHVCRALHYMHSHNLVHLDVKPANILIAFANGVASVDADGEWVMDANNAAACLGVDKLSSRTAVSLATTHTQAMLTTPFSSSSSTANARYDSLGIAGPRMSQAFPLQGACSLSNTSTQPGQNMTIRVTEKTTTGSGSQGPAPSLVCEVRGVVYKLGDLGQVADINAQSVQEGDTKYLSRELLQGDCSNLAASDIFSLGASLYELATGRELPVTGQPFQDLRDGNLETLPDYSEDLQSLIREMMHPEPARRPSAAAILERPLLRMRQSTVGMGLRGINNVSPSEPMSPAQTWGGSLLPFSSAKADLPSVHESPQDHRQPQPAVTAAVAGLWSPQQFPATSVGSGGRGISTAPFLTAPTSAGLITSQPAVTAMPPSARAVRPRSPPASTPLVRPRIRSRLPGHVGDNADDQLAAAHECISSSDAAERVSPVPPMPSLNSPLESTSPPPLPLSQQRHTRTQSHDASDQPPFMKLQATVQPHDQARLERRKAVAEANANSAAGRSGQVAEVLMSRFEAATGSPAHTATAFNGLSDRAGTDTNFASDFTVPSATVRPSRGYQSPEQRKLSLLQRHMSGVRQQQQQRQQQRLHEQQQQQDKAAGFGQSGLPHPEGSPALLVTRRSTEQSMQDSMDDASLLATMSVAPDAPRDQLLATIAALQSQLRQLTQSGSGSSSYAMEDDKHVGQPDMRDAVYH